MTKILRVRLELQIEPDEFGLHALQADTRQWLTDLRDNAKGHGFTVVIDPVEDAKGLRAVRKRGPGKRKAANSAPIVAALSQETPYFPPSVLT